MSIDEKLTSTSTNSYLSILFDYHHYMNELSSVTISAFEKFIAIKPMFDLKENLNETNRDLYSHIFGFEQLFESQKYVDGWKSWMQKNWKYTIHIGFLYILLVFLGKFLMRNKTKYELRLPLIIWNIILALFSITGTIRVLPDFLRVLTDKGVVHSVCNNDYAYGITGFWSLMFILSKLPELVDTLFIVLRKQELIFLHWYHHATVLIYCWFSYKDYASTGRWFMTMNYLVHSLMYSYYALRAMRFKIPRFAAQLITTGQILQMIAGCFVNYIAYKTKVSNEYCGISDENVKYSSLMYFSYFVLFFDFFIKAYIYNKNKSAAKKLESDHSKKKN
jgi:elongation of very long chain fatty acids protein 6